MIIRLGQGPYFGQATWFARFHPEKIPSAIDRYVNEIFRVIGVLDRVLASSPSGWLVGEKFTYADVSFVTWDTVGEGLLRELNMAEDLEARFPHYMAWREAMSKRLPVKLVKETMIRGRISHGL